MTLYRRWGKRACDAVVGAVLLVVFLPVIVTVAVAVRATLGAPVLFRQQRPGRFGAPFTMLKFRTMTDAQDVQGRPLSDDARLTPTGRLLRRWSLDELPELWNVIAGDMSLVGPRPLLMQYLPRYTAEQFRRHEVRPGITGLAQVEGRNALSWDDRFRLDAAYVDRVSITTDLAILARTFRAVLSREGISASGCATMTEFIGQAGPGADREAAAGRSDDEAGRVPDAVRGNPRG